MGGAGWRGRIFTLTFKEQTQCSVGWHICLLFHSKIKLLSMWKFKSSLVAAVFCRFVLLLFPFCVIFFSFSLSFFMSARLSVLVLKAPGRSRRSACVSGVEKPSFRRDLGPTSVVALGHMERPDRAPESVGVARAAVVRTGGLSYQTRQRSKLGLASRSAKTGRHCRETMAAEERIGGGGLGGPR